MADDSVYAAVFAVFSRPAAPQTFWAWLNRELPCLTVTDILALHMFELIKLIHRREHTVRSMIHRKDWIGGG